MKVDGSLLPRDLSQAGVDAQRLEALGFDGAVTFEGPHDPFFPLVLAAAATERLELKTAIAIAFARTPMILANIGYDLQALSRGRFTLGLGSQIRPHIERRFSMPWSRPADRMRELVLAIRAIWACWHEGEPLDFRGDFYTHTLMTPMFNPGPNPHGLPRIAVAGVGPRMTEVAGEVADSFLVHPLHTKRYIEEVTLPALERGRARSPNPGAPFEIAAQVLVATGETEPELERARAFVRAQIAFYGSTPAYRPVLACHGWEALQPELRALTKAGRWDEMANLVDDEILEAVAMCGPVAEVAKRLRERVGGYADRIAPMTPYLSDPEKIAPLLVEVREAGSS